MAVRNILCLPALTGDWRHPAGGAVLSTSGFFDMNDGEARTAGSAAKVEMPQPAHDQHGGHWGCAARSEAADPRALRIQLEPGRGRARLGKVVKGFSREDLFTVVHEQFATDTCDYADIVLPATTQLEHHDVHTAYGHLYVVANSPAIAPLGESLPNSEAFRRLAARMGFAEECFSDSDETSAARRSNRRTRACRASSGSSSRRKAGSD